MASNMFSGKKNKVHSTSVPPPKPMEQLDQQQLSQMLQQVTGQLNLMLELQQQQQQHQQQQQKPKNSYNVTNISQANTIDEPDLYDCTHRHHQHRESSQGNASHHNFCHQNSRAMHQNHHQQCSISPSMSSFFMSTRRPQSQCIVSCPHDTRQQNCYHHQQPCHHNWSHYGYTSFQQSQCTNSAMHCNQLPCHHSQHHNCHWCAPTSSNQDMCNGPPHPDLPTAITSPQQSSIIPESARSLNVSHTTSHNTATHFNPCTLFGQSGYCKNNTPYAPHHGSAKTIVTATTSSTQTKFNNQIYPDLPLPPFPRVDPYVMDDDLTTTNQHNAFYSNNGDQQLGQQWQRPMSPRFSPIANSTTASSPPPPPIPRRTEDLIERRQHQLSWTDIYRRDLLSRQDALISPTVSSCNNTNAIRSNKVNKTMPGHSHLRGWWIHGKYRWNQLRKKKFPKCFM